MGAPIGNKNGRGAKGRSGRKSYRVERADAQYLADFFFKEHTEEEIKEMVAKNRSVSKIMLAKALAGNERYTLAVFNKLFPDNTNVNFGGRVVISVLKSKEVLDLFHDESNSGKTETTPKDDAGGAKDSN